MRKVLMSPDKVQSQLRKKGFSSLDAVLAAVIEPDGSCSVIPYGGFTHLAAHCARQGMATLKTAENLGLQPGHDAGVCAA